MSYSSVTKRDDFDTIPVLRWQHLVSWGRRMTTKHLSSSVQHPSPAALRAVVLDRRACHLNRATFLL